MFSKSSEKAPAPKPARSESNPKMLFGKKVGESSTTSVFANKPSESEKKNTVSVFGSSLQSKAPAPQAKSLFGGRQESKPEPKAQPKVEETKAAPAEKPKEPEKAPVSVIPEKPVEKPSLFGGKSAPVSTSLFGKKPEQSSTTQSLFAKKEEQPVPSSTAVLAAKVEESVTKPNIFTKKAEDSAPASASVNPFAKKATNLFTTPVNKAEEKSEEKSAPVSSISSQKVEEKPPAPTTSLFGKKIETSDSKIGGLFGKKPDATTPDPNTTKQGLLGAEGKGVSIFGKKADDSTAQP